MLGIIITFLLLISIIYGIYSGNVSNLSSAAVNGCTRAVELAIFLSGSMALWCGLMKVAEKSGIVKNICKLISPITCKIIKGLEKNSKAYTSVNMNITANLLGLGNAATPMGIAAVKELNKDKSVNSQRNLAIFTVLNCSSIQIIPTTVAAVRLSHGSDSPFAIIPAVILTSLISAAVGCITAYLLYSSKVGK